MFCNNCGREIDDKAAVCPNCGVATNNLSKANTNQTNTMAVVGFIFSFFIALVGLICSIIGLKKSKEMNDSGKGLAIAGIIISSISIAVTIIFFIILFGSIAAIA